MCPKYYKFNMFEMNITIHLIEWPQLTKTTTTTKLLATKCRQDAEQQELLYIDDTKWNSYFAVWQLFMKCEAYTCHIISPTPRYLFKKNENLHLHKNLYMNIYDRFIHNCPKLEIT